MHRRFTAHAPDFGCNQLETMEINIVENGTFTHEKTLTKRLIRGHSEGGSKRFVEQQASGSKADRER